MHLPEPDMQIKMTKHVDIPASFRLEGWVYVLSNESMPGIYKVGMTTTSPQIRAKELSSATGVPTPFKVEGAFHCEDPSGSERDIHESLSEFRVNESREFFRTELSYIFDACREYSQGDVLEEVHYMAMSYDVISFESLDSLNVRELLDETGLYCFGDKLAIAERLIRIGAQFVMEQHSKKRRAIVFSENQIFSIQDAESQHYEELARNAEQMKGI